MEDPVVLTAKQWAVIKMLVEQLSSAFDYGPDIYQEHTGISTKEFDELIEKLRR